MPQISWLQIAAFGALFLCAAMLAAALRIRYWRKQGRKLELDQKYVSPPNSWLRRLFRWSVSKFTEFIYLGPMKRYGNLPSEDFQGLDIYYANHQDEHDALVSMRVLGFRKARFFIAFNQCRGKRAGLVSFSGGIPVDFYDEVGKDTPASNGSQPLDRPISPRRLLAAVQAATERLCEELGTAFWIFPQGRLVRDNKLTRDDFHEGLMRIGRDYTKKTGRPVRFIPVAIAYDRSRAGRTLFHKCLNLVGIRFRTFMNLTTSRYAVGIGTPIVDSTLPPDRKEATTVLFEALVSLCQETSAKL